MLKDSALEDRVWRKLDLRVLPVVAIFYLLSFLVSSVGIPGQVKIDFPYRIALI